MNKQHFTELRNSLLTLHKSLMDYQQKVHEGQFGKIDSPRTLLNLLMESQEFAWLRRVSELVVGIDELLESKTEVPEQKFVDLLDYSKKLLTPNQTGSEFEKNYYLAIHKNPAVALAHGKAQQILEKI